DYPDPPPLNSAVIVDVERGEDLGYIHSLGDLAQKRNGGCSHGCGTSLPERKALRLASEKDRGLSVDLDRLNEEARRKAMERARVIRRANLRDEAGRGEVDRCRHFPGAHNFARRRR